MLIDQWNDGRFHPVRQIVLPAFDHMQGASRQQALQANAHGDRTATALEHDIPVLTGNVKHFVAVPGLNVVAFVR
jgi:hypothetical protein